MGCKKFAKFVHLIWDLRRGSCEVSKKVYDLVVGHLEVLVKIRVGGFGRWSL